MIARIAAGQLGVVTRKQLLAAGLGAGAIDHRLLERRLHRLHRGVYLVGHDVAPQFARELAAVLACGEDAVASHEAAAGIWALRTPPSGAIDITVPGRTLRSRAGLRVHRTGRLDPLDVSRHRGIPVTAPARTIVDLAASLPVAEVARAFEQAQVRRLVRRDHIVGALTRYPGRRGVAVTRLLLESDSPPALTRSEAEARLLTLLRAADLPPTHLNKRLGRHEVDMLWLPQRLVVEVDGFAYHANRAAFERDRLRDAELHAGGYRVIRVTWRQIQGAPEALVARIAQALVR